MCKLYNTLITEISEIHRLDSVIFQRFDGGHLIPLHISYLGSAIIPRIKNLLISISICNNSFYNFLPQIVHCICPHCSTFDTIEIGPCKLE